MTIRRAKPLPECPACDRPTLREAFLANGGLCSACADEVTDLAPPAGDVAADTVKMLPVRDVPLPLLDDLTGYVEGYRPPVPERRRTDA